MTEEHTPGPWKVDGLTVESVTDGNICLVNLARPKGPTEANLRLIAAAPDLLQAIEDVVESWDSDQYESPLGRKVREAMAKAKGDWR